MVKIYSDSDDIVCIENSRYFEDEIGCFDVAGVRLFLDDNTILFVCFSSGIWRIFIEQEGSAPHRHKVCQKTSDDDYSDEFFPEACCVRLRCEPWLGSLLYLCGQDAVS